MANVAHAVMVTSTIANGRVTKIDTSAAMKVAGRDRGADAAERAASFRAPRRGSELGGRRGAGGARRAGDARADAAAGRRRALQRPADRPRRRGHVRARDGSGAARAGRRMRTRNPRSTSRTAPTRSAGAGEAARRRTVRTSAATCDAALASAPVKSIRRTRRRSRITIRWRCTTRSRVGTAITLTLYDSTQGIFSVRNTRREDVRHSARERACRRRTSPAADSAARAARGRTRCSRRWRREK